MKLVKRLGVAVALIALAVPVIAQIRFPDVPDDHERADSIRWAAAEGLFRGYPDGSFKPDRNLSENEFRIVIRRLYDRYDAWTRADVAHFLRHGINGLQPAPPAPATTRPATPTTTTAPPAPTTTRPATPTTTRESVIYYTARGAEWAAQAAEYRPNDIYKDRERAVIAYNLASAAYSNACGALYTAGLHPIAIYMPLSKLADAAANRFADNPDVVASAVVIGYCDTALLYSLASDNLRFKTPQADHSFGNARLYHDFAALAAEYAEIGAAGLRAANHLLTGGYDFIFTKHTALTAKHDFLSYQYSSAAHYAAAAAESAIAEHSKAAGAAALAARTAAELAANWAGSAANDVISAAAAAGGADWTHNTDNYLAGTISAARRAASASASASASAAAHAAEYAGIAEHTAELAAHYADEWASADPAAADKPHKNPASITAGAAARADFAALSADLAARYSSAAAEWASYAAGR